MYFGILVSFEFIVKNRKIVYNIYIFFSFLLEVTRMWAPAAINYDISSVNHLGLLNAVLC